MSRTKPEILRPQRSAHASIRGYLYQVCLGAKRWLELTPGEVLLCEGDEDLDRLVLDESGESICEQVKALRGTVNVRDRVVLETLRNFVLGYVGRRRNGDRRRFIFTCTAELRPQRESELGVDVLHRWASPADRPSVIEAVGKLLRTAASGEGKQETARAVTGALDWLDAEPDRWPQFLDSVEWHFGTPDVEQVRTEIVALLANNPDVGEGLATGFLDRLMAEVFLASSRPEPEARVLDSDALRTFLQKGVEDLAQWAESRQGRRIREVLSEAAGIDGVLSPGTRPLPSAEMAPGRVLMAAYEIIPFHEEGRRDELERLADWCRDSRPASVQLITGEGGTGKTRLLIEWCKRLKAQGWHAGFLVHRPPGDWCPVLLQGHVPRLVVVDYAETRRPEVESLLQRLADRHVRRSPKLRVVLLARREADWWRQLSAGSAEVGDLLLGSPTPSPVAPLVPQAQERLAVYRAALEVFAEARHVELPRGGRLPALAAAVYDRILYLHAAALVAVLRGEPAETERVFDEILEHETRFWQRQARETFGADAATVGQIMEAMPRFVAAVTLAGGVTPRDARPLVCNVTRLVEGEHDLPGTLLELARRLYGGRRAAVAASPDIDPDPTELIEPLQPDLLGERLVAKTLDQHLLGAVLGWAGVAARRNVLTVLTRLAQGQPSESRWLRAALQFDLEGLAELAFDAAVAAGDPIGRVLAEVIESTGSTQLAERLADRCDTEALWQSVPVRELAAVATRLVFDERKRASASPTEEDLAEIARLANNLGSRYRHLGQREEALAAASEAVEISRKLVAARPDAFLFSLAMSLNNLGNSYSELGRREDALEATSEAVEHYRKLAAARPEAFLPDLATTLNNLGNTYSDLGQREEALAATSEAVEHYRRLAAGRPEAFLPDLAMTLNNLGTMYGDLGRREKDLAATSEAVEHYRNLAAARPDAFLPYLAGTLNNLGAVYSELARREEGLAATSEAVEIRRKLAAARPQAFLPDLAMTLNNLGNRYSDLGQREEALAATSEAVEHYRNLAAARPDAFLPYLAGTLNNLGNRYSYLGRSEEAIELYREAVSTLAPVFARYPAATRRNMVGFVGNYVRLASALGREPDRELLAPILAALQGLEDGPDDREATS